jgi:hypothetical protein
MQALGLNEQSDDASLLDPADTNESHSLIESGFGTSTLGGVIDTKPVDYNDDNACNLGLAVPSEPASLHLAPNAHLSGVEMLDTFSRSSLRPMLGSGENHSTRCDDYDREKDGARTASSPGSQVLWQRRWLRVVQAAVQLRTASRRAFALQQRVQNLETELQHVQGQRMVRLVVGGDVSQSDRYIIY